MSIWRLTEPKDPAVLAIRAGLDSPGQDIVVRDGSEVVFNFLKGKQNILVKMTTGSLNDILLLTS